VHVCGAGTATPFVTNIDSNARGQRVKVEHGNGTVTTYEYDPETFRLARRVTVRTGDQETLQDLSYVYDAVGNIVQITDAVS
jgi:YD repeat-containing protein